MIGLGIGERHVEALVNDSRVSVEVVCDFDREKAADIAEKYAAPFYCSDWKKLISDFQLDAVILASYDHCHAEQLIEFIKQGVHIFVEKPLCTTSEELSAIQQEYDGASRRKKILLSSNFILRKERRFQNLKKEIDAGKLGEIYSIEASYDYGRIHKILKGWRGTAPNYSVMNGGGVHMLDLCQWLCGASFTPLFALHNKLVTLNSPFLAPDFTTALGRMGDAVMKLTANFGSQTPHYHQLKIYGTKGTFINDCATGTYFFGNEPNVERVEDDFEFPCANKGDLLPNFVDAILQGANLEIGFDEVASVMTTSLLVDQLANKNN